MLNVALFWAALTASAHEIYPIEPVRAVLRAEPGRTVLDLRTDSIFWILEVIATENLPAVWPEDSRRRVEGYVNAHFQLTVDGRPWRGTLAQASHRQWPWESHEQGELRLRLVYPEAPAGSELAGNVDFFKEYREELKAEPGKPLLHPQTYQTVLEVPGRAPARFELTPSSTRFAVPADDARRSGLAMTSESLVTGFTSAAAAASAWPAALALALALGPQWPGRRKTAALALALGAAAALARPAPAAAAWLAGLTAALAAGDWLGARGGAVAAALSAAALAAVWTSAAAPWLPGLPPGLPARGAAWLGALAGGVGLLGLASWGAALERRRAAADSQSHADDLFARRRRLAATAVLVVCAWGLAGALS